MPNEKTYCYSIQSLTGTIMMLYINLTIALLGRNLARLARIWMCISLHAAIPEQYTSENSEVIRMEMKIHMIESCVHGFHFYQVPTTEDCLPHLSKDKNATNPCAVAEKSRSFTCKIPAIVNSYALYLLA